MYETHQLGVSISYSRVLEFEAWSAAAAVCNNGVICPVIFGEVCSLLRYDNIDPILSSSTVSGSFPGTMFQFPTVSYSGTNRPPIQVPSEGPVALELP